MSPREAAPRPPRSPRPPSLPRALAFAGVAVGIAATLFLVAVATRSQRGGAPPTDILGSQLPPGWEPGAAGVGRPPPPPPDVPTPPQSAAPEAPVVTPYGQAEPRGPRAQEPPAPYAEATPPLVAREEATPEPQAEEPPLLAYTPPRLVSLPDPSYPRIGERMGMEATIVLRVRVSSRGRVLDAEPIGEEVGYGFEAEAIRAARRASFEPAQRDGVPITADTRLAVQFRMRN